MKRNKSELTGGGTERNGILILSCSVSLRCYALLHIIT